jgi:hypothetical protein
MQGTRVADVENPYEPHPILNPGEYRRMKENDEWVWYACTPNGCQGNLAAHDITEHEDGTITVSSSILCKRELRGDNPGDWHGYLEQGVWREV